MVCCCFPFRKSRVMREKDKNEERDDCSTQESVRGGIINPKVVVRGDRAKNEMTTARAALLPFLGQKGEGQTHGMTALASSEFIEILKGKITPHFIEPSAGMPRPPTVEPVTLLRGPSDLCLKTGISAKTVTCVSRAISQSIDTVLYPLLGTVLDEYEMSAKTSDAQIDLPVITAKCRALLQPSVSSTVEAGLLALGWLSGLVFDQPVPATGLTTFFPSSLYVSSICRLVGLAEHITNTTSLDSYVSLLTLTGVLLGKLQRIEDWPSHLPYFALHSGAKGQLIRSLAKQQSSGEMSLRSLPKAGLMASVGTIARKSGVYKGRKGLENKLVMLHSSFKDSDDVGAEVKGTREVFELLSNEIMAEWKDPLSVTPSKGWAALQECSSYVRVMLREECSSLTASFAIGSKMEFKKMSSLYHHEHFRIDDTLVLMILGVENDPDSECLLLKCDKTAPVTASELSFTLYQPGVPLFKKDRVSPWLWFNCSLGMLNEEDQEEWLEQYAFVGWLMAEAVLNNSVLNIGLPTVFFTMLKAWPDYTPTRDDLVSLGGATGASIDRIQEMEQSELRKLLELQGLPGQSTPEEYVKHLAGEILVKQVEKLMAACVTGFHATGMRSLVVFRHMVPEEMRSLVCGRSSEDIAYHCLRYEFIVVEDEEFRRYDYGEVFLEVLWEVLHEGLNKVNKKLFLKFLTGTSNLPAVSQTEVLRVECFSDPSASPESLQLRLPQSHTCHNTLSIPNYAEAVLFTGNSLWYSLSGHQDHAVTDDHRKTAWKTITQSPHHADIRQEIYDLTRAKILQAIGADEEENG